MCVFELELVWCVVWVVFFLIVFCLNLLFVCVILFKWVRWNLGVYCIVWILWV